jgi:hypothetical protein
MTAFTVHGVAPIEKKLTWFAMLLVPEPDPPGCSRHGRIGNRKVLKVERDLDYLHVVVDLTFDCALRKAWNASA